MPGARPLVWLVVAACSAPIPSASSSSPACDTQRRVRVVDEAGAPVQGARVRAVASSLQCGPSGLPEGCGSRTDESPVVITDASGTASVCELARYPQPRIVVEYRDWPTAAVPGEATPTITIGPGRSLVVEVPDACPGMQHVHVTAYPEGGADTVVATRLPGDSQRQHLRLAGLGPWRYWVRSRDDRSGNSALEAAACPSFVRVVEGRLLPDVLVLDRSDMMLEVPSFAGARATVRPFDHPDEVMATATLDGHGRASMSLPATTGTSFCLRLDKDDRCWITYAHVGGVARPEQYVNRDYDPAIPCGQCPAAARTEPR